MRPRWFVWLRDGSPCGYNHPHNVHIIGLLFVFIAILGLGTNPQSFDQKRRIAVVQGNTRLRNVQPYPEILESLIDSLLLVLSTKLRFVPVWSSLNRGFGVCLQLESLVRWHRIASYILCKIYPSQTRILEGRTSIWEWQLSMDRSPKYIEKDTPTHLFGLPKSSFGMDKFYTRS